MDAFWRAGRAEGLTRTLETGKSMMGGERRLEGKGREGERGRPKARGGWSFVVRQTSRLPLCRTLPLLNLVALPLTRALVMSPGLHSSRDLHGLR